MRTYRAYKFLMGSAFELLVVHNNEKLAHGFLNMGIAEIQRIEALLSTFAPSSETSYINNNAGKAVQVSVETFQLINRCMQLSRLTQGAFDVTTPPLKSLYNFKGKYFNFPSEKRIKETLQLVGYDKVKLLPDQNICLQKKGMKLSFAAIGKGYAADCVKKLWKSNGLKNGLINASGDISVLGKKENGQAWSVGIANPNEKEKIAMYMNIEKGAIATSGNYEQFFEYNGKKYSHNINPKTGKPLDDITSATIIGESAEMCDALATAVSVLGSDVGSHLIEQLPHLHCIIMDQKETVYCSNDLKVKHEEACE